MEGDHPDLRAAIDMLESYRKFAPDDEELLDRIQRLRGEMEGNGTGLPPEASDPHEGHDHGPPAGAPSFDDGAEAPADSG
jgi:hypothetical protein